MNATAEFSGPDPSQVRLEVERALAEDIDSGDVSAALVDDRTARARIISREQAVVCGRAWVEQCFSQLDSGMQFEWRAQDGEAVDAGAELCQLQGSARALLSGERTALNFLQLLSATASEAARYARALSGSRTRVMDTRKTLPGLRHAQKYAVRCGGGVNHRIGLYDAIMLKENHIAAAGSIAAALSTARQRFPQLPLIIEVETLQELQQVLDQGGADRVLVDDFSLEDLHRAVELCQGRQALEVSGGVGFDRLTEIAATGVDFVSVGALTKHVRAIDLSMRMLS